MFLYYIFHLYYIFLYYILYLIFLDVLHLKSESWNELEEQEEFFNNIPDQKLNHMEKANLLRYIYIL